MIRVYGIEECPFCRQLRNLLEKENIIHEYIDSNLPENEPKFWALTKVTNSNDLPTVIVGKHILVPNSSFSTIIECFELIKKLMN